MKSVHLVEISTFSGNLSRRQYLRAVDNIHIIYYWEYELEDGQLFIGDNIGTSVVKKGYPHREFKVREVITNIESLPTELRDNEALYKWENNTRIRCSIEESKKYFEDT
jgi:hypothetical protein